MDSGEKNISSGWCLFCSNSLSSETTETDSIALHKHLTLIERFFRNANKTDKTLGIEMKRNDLIGTCENCGDIVKGFSKLYQEMKRIELKLNWRLDSLKMIVEKAEGKNRSNLKLRGASLKNAGRVEKLEKPVDELLEFQKNFVQKCSLYFIQSYPRLTLKRYHRPEQEPVTLSVLDSHQLLPADKSSNRITDKNLNCGLTAKINKRVPEFRIPELETLDINASVAASAPSIVLDGRKSGLEFDKLEETETTTTPAFQGDDDESTSSATTCDHISTSNIKVEEQPILFYDDDHDEDNDTMSIDAADPLVDGNNSNDVGRENAINSSDSLSTPTPENESVSRFRRRFGCSQCTLSFTSEGSLEIHLTSAHVQLEDLPDKDDVDGKSESELETGDDDDAPHDDLMKSESDSNFDIMEEGETDEEFEEKPLKSELESGDDESEEIKARKSVKRKRSRGKKRDSKVVRDLKCGKCEAWSGESGVPLHVHVAKHRYLHTNGQEALTDKNPDYLNIKWSDLKVEIEGKVIELKEEFTAPGCGRKFALKENFDHHLQLHGNYKCANADCKITTNCFMDLVDHENSHSAKLRVRYSNYETKCARCEFQTGSSRAMFSHYLVAHPGGISDMRAFADHHCAICKFRFDKVSGYFPMLHFLNKHDLSRIDDPSKVHRCEVPDCSAYFLTLGQLQVHRQILHFNAVKESSLSTSSNKKKRRMNKIMLANIQKAKVTEDGLTVENFILRKGAEFKCVEASCKNMAFFTEEEMNIHRKLHGDFKCNFCEKVENYAPNLCRHELEAHSKTANVSVTRGSHFIECPRCPKTSQNCTRYIIHHLGKHFQLENDGPRCLICGVLFLAENEALEQRIFTHFKEYHDLSTMHNTEGEDDMVWRCKNENCTAYFLSRFQLSNHVQHKHCVKGRVRKLPCLECGKIYVSPNSFSQHMLKCHPEAFQKFFPFPCPIDGCIRRCETDLSLRRHLLKSHPKNPEQYLCPVCGKEFQQAWALSGHMKLHNEGENKERNFVCDQCGNTFATEWHLEQHKKFHIRQELRKCEICSRKFSTKQKLEKHLRTHTKVKPFQCEHCGASYSQRRYFRIHVQEKHGVEVVSTRVSKKVNKRIKAKNAKKVGDADIADGPGTSASQTKRRKPKRRRMEWVGHEEHSAADSDFTD